MIAYIIITALTVSIDSFLCGFSLALNTKKKLPIVLGIALTVFFMCLATNYLAKIFADKITEQTTCIGGLILICVGIYNLLKKDNVRNAKNNSLLGLTIATGLAVGLDGAFANLSLSLMGMNAFYVPLIIALMHAFTIAFGIMLANTRLALKLAKIDFIPPLILIVLGVYKLFGLFI